jgi:hypothetical protein
MTREIRPLAPEDLLELSRFLTSGFHVSPDADFAAPEVLRWKYLDAEPSAPADEVRAVGGDAPRSLVARDEAGRIIGHLGVCRTAFEGKALAAAGGRIETLHVIDWLGSHGHKALGASLLRRAQQGVATQFAVGATEVATAIGERSGYEVRDRVPVYTRVLRAGYWLRAGGLGPWQRGLRLARETAGRLIRPASAPRAVIVLRRAARFGSEIGPIVESAGEHAILTSRTPVRLNAVLDFPRQAMSGWHLLNADGRLSGLAVLNIIPKDGGRTRTGKVVDCLLDGDDIDAWHAAFAALTGELARQGADLTQAYGSTPWAAEALRRNGYTSRFGVKFILRDRQGLIPKEAMFYFTPLDGDYAYT